MSDVFRDYTGLMLCDDCPASGICESYGEGRDNKCCFGSYYYKGLCQSCALRPDGVADLCRSLQGVLVVKEEHGELACSHCGDEAGWSEVCSDGRVSFVCGDCFLFTGNDDYCQIDGTVHVLVEC